MKYNHQKYTVGQAAEMLGVSKSMVLRLCNSGLVPGVRRDRSLHRVFEEWQVNHIRTLLGLRDAGLSKAELKRYANLVRQGSSTLPERKALMDTQRRQLWQTLEDIQASIDFLERQSDLIDQEIHQKNNQVNN